MLPLYSHGHSVVAFLVSLEGKQHSREAADAAGIHASYLTQAMSQAEE
jgi:hypothetical protein